MVHCIAPGQRNPHGAWRKFLLLLHNAPSHACKLAGDHCKTVLHGTVEFQPPCSPDLSLFIFYCGTSPRHSSSVSNCCQSRRNAGTFDPRVSWDVDSRRWMFEKVGNAWVRKLDACVAAKSGFFGWHRHGRPHRAAQGQCLVIKKDRKVGRTGEEQVWLISECSW